MGHWRLRNPDEVRLVKGTMGGGLIFNLSSRRLNTSCQMVRFSGHEKLWCGSFDSGGVFDLKHSQPTGLAKNSKGWVTLTVTVRNSSGTYDIAVNGKQLAKALKLRLVPRAGQARCVALTSSHSHVAFDDVKLSPRKSSGK